MQNRGILIENLVRIHVLPLAVLLQNWTQRPCLVMYFCLCQVTSIKIEVMKKYTFISEEGNAFYHSGILD